MVARFYGSNDTVVYKWRIAVSSLLSFKRRLGAQKCCIILHLLVESTIRLLAYLPAIGLVWQASRIATTSYYWDSTRQPALSYSVSDERPPFQEGLSPSVEVVDYTSKYGTRMGSVDMARYGMV